MTAIVEIKNRPYSVLRIEIDRKSGDLIISQKDSDREELTNRITVQKKQIGELFQQILRRYLWEVEEKIQGRDKWEREVLNWEKF